MEFIREKIKKKPISKRRIMIRVGIAALCGLAFILAVCLAVLIVLPIIEEKRHSNSSGIETESEMSTENSEALSDLVIPPDFNLSVNDYQTLQDELYSIGTLANKSIVMVSQMEGDEDFPTNGYENSAQGSGLIIADDDNYIYILTERRLVSAAVNIRVFFVDGTGAEATMLKYDGNTGLAVLAIEKRQVKASTYHAICVAKLGSEQPVTNGAIVIALGSPLGTNYSIVTGNITSVENEVITCDKNYSIFTTDIVGTKNGSGVLINASGEVIGIIMQSFHSSQDATTLTAVAYLEIAELVERLQNGKSIPYVGIYISTITDEIAADYEIPKGVYIREVAMDSPAMKAGLQSGDVITHINGEEVLTDDAISEKISQLISGTTCEMSVKRQNGNEYYEVKCTVTIGVLE